MDPHDPDLVVLEVYFIVLAVYLDSILRSNGPCDGERQQGKRDNQGGSADRCLMVSSPL